MKPRQKFRKPAQESVIRGAGHVICPSMAPEVATFVALPTKEVMRILLFSADEEERCRKRNVSLGIKGRLSEG